MPSNIRIRAGVLAFCWLLVLCCVRHLPLMAAEPEARDLFVTSGKSLVVESPVQIQRIAVGNAKVAEAVAVSPREILVNGKDPGETSLIVWQQGGNRLLFDLRVRESTSKLDAVREQLRKEMPGQDVSIDVADGTVFVGGTVSNMMAADRALALASALGKPVNMLNVKVPPVEQQILLQVRFANVDRAATKELGANLFSTGALNTIGSTTTQQFTPPKITMDQNKIEATFTDLLNIFLFRPDLNLGATIRALQSRRLLEMLAEPNLLAMNGRPANFLAGGEFPVPVVQSGISGGGAVTIQWREFGIRINFTPYITPRGTIRLKLAPEVSSLDYSNAVTIQGFVVPALSTRRVETEVELESGQSFAIAGLLNNQVVESWSKIPGIGDIPLIGKLFQSKASNKTNNELLVVVTPDIVRPVPKEQAPPGIEFPKPFLQEAPATVPRTPGIGVTGPVPVTPPMEAVPYQQLNQLQEQMKDQPATPQIPMMQLVPVQIPGAAAVPMGPAAPSEGNGGAAAPPR